MSDNNKQPESFDEWFDSLSLEEQALFVEELEAEYFIGEEPFIDFL